MPFSLSLSLTVPVGKDGDSVPYRRKAGRQPISASAEGAKPLQEKAQTQIGAGVTLHSKATVTTGLLPVCGAAVFDLLQRLQISLVVRLHGYGPFDMFQRCDLVTQSVIGDGAQIVPPGVPLGAVLQHIQRLPIAAVANVIIRRTLIGIFLGLLRIAPLLRTVGVVAIALVASLRLRFFGILDLFVGGVDLLHFFGSFRITGVSVRVILLC